MNTTENTNLTWNEFMKVEMRVGTIIEAAIFVDFGPLVKRKTSAQITKLYQPEDILGKQVVAVVNFPPKQIANMMSECLILGGIGNDKEVTLLVPDGLVENGMRIG